MWILKTLGGSHAYGTNVAGSDIDTRGIFYEPDDGLTPARDQFSSIIDGKKSDDHTFYNLKKFFFLAQKCNPTILEPLYIENPEHILFETVYSKRLRENRDIFLSSVAAGAYLGYASQQTSRMKNHNKWINQPAGERKPDETEFMFLIDSVGTIYKRPLRMALDTLFPVKHNKSIYRLYRRCLKPKVTRGVFTKTPGQIPEHDSAAMEDFAGVLIFNREEYVKAVTHWRQYWQWKNNRNPERGKLEEEFGYDAKHASHSIRLLRTGIELLKTGRVNVFRPDREELIGIKHGAWTYEQVNAHSEELTKEIKDIYVNKKYVIPEEPDTKKINEVFKGILEDIYREDHHQLGQITA